MLIANLVDNIERVNFGIWSAAINSAQVLEEQYGHRSQIWFPEIEGALPEELRHVEPVALPKAALRSRRPQLKGIERPDVVVTHGCWQYPTRWGAALRRQGIPWVYTPHGMLEPWSLKQKRWKKKAYWHLMEGRLTREADAIRAVGGPEQQELMRFFTKVKLIPNGVEMPEMDWQAKEQGPRTLLFLGRLHHKKNPGLLAEAWLKSALNNSQEWRLVFAGPDQGEAENLQRLCDQSHNMEYRGAVYGQEKKQLMQQASVFVLPSQSEGFPTTVVEAMSHGLMSGITPQCNFPEAERAGLVEPIAPEANPQTLADFLKRLPRYQPEDFRRTGEQAREFVQRQYSTEAIAFKLHLQYQFLTSKD